MTANDVYNVAKALSSEELTKLCNMLNSNVKNKKEVNKQTRKRIILPEFTKDDAIKYLIENHFSKKREA
ncbi:hypothetical protein FG167_08770 [Lacinutrix sp. WUR7]|uniref:hypothetical protein n=1 Tax=Lacinutrix sp. WUR7 TaxID=2653681 RepID=UPI00193E6D58|nr:hypothetical protein [Lacinutrix sp. WUR7]QRM89322.1 hypothetical protein FG167_08770 [Lacinutrix sp. WUR7]